MEARAKVGHLPARGHLGTLPNCSADHLRDLVEPGLVDQRPHVQVRLLRGVAIAGRCHGLGHLVDEGVGYLALYVNPFGAVAHLPGVDHPRGDDGLHRQVQVGIAQHDCRRLAAEFEVQLGDVRRRCGHDPRTGGDAAGEAHEVHPGMAGKAMANTGALAADHIEDPRRQIGLGHQTGEFIAVDRCFFAGFDHNGITGDQRRCHLARNQEKREIPRQDARHHAQRLAHEENVLAGAVAGQHLALQAPPPFGHVVQVIGSEIDLDLSQGRYLAAFLGDDTCQAIGVGPHFCRDLTQVPRTLDGGFRRPAALCLACCGDGALNLFGRGLRHPCEQLAVGRIVDFDQGLAADEAVVDEVLVGRIAHGRFTPLHGYRPTAAGRPVWR